MRRGAFAVGVLPLVLVLAAGMAHAQVPPLPASQPFVGFLSPYEIVHRVRTAGFDPLAPPLREGTTYAVRATDFRGILMRVVVDARTGAIRDVARIVPGPGRYGQYAYGEPPYDPAEFDAPLSMPVVPSLEPPAAPQSIPPALVHPGARPAMSAPAQPPLPRPRPAALASRRPNIDGEPNGLEWDAKDRIPAGGAEAPTGSTAKTKPDGVAPTKPEINSEIMTAAPPPAVPNASAPPKKSSGDPPVNN